MPSSRSYINFLSRLTVLRALLVFSLACPPGNFPDRDGTSGICHPCSLCEDPNFAVKTDGCTVCAPTVTTPSTPDCGEGMVRHPKINSCFHCSVCLDIENEDKWINSGCDQCDNRNSRNQDPPDVKITVEQKRITTTPSPMCKDGMVWHPEVKTCVNCSACVDVKDKEKWKNGGCNLCDVNQTNVQRPVELNLKVQNKPTEHPVQIGIIIAVSALTIAVLTLVIVMVLIKCRRTTNTSKRQDSVWKDTRVDMTGRTPFQTTYTTSIETNTNVESSNQMSMEYTARTKIATSEQRGDDKNPCTMDRPVEDGCPPGKRPDDWNIIENQGQSGYALGTPV